MNFANLDMDVLRTLVMAMDLGSFAKAAERLGRSQSALSMQMRRLEDSVGRPLFRKEGRGLGLTDAGDVLLGYARHILTLNDEAVAAARGISVEGTVRFGVPLDFGENCLPNVLGRFSRLHPSVTIEARVDCSYKLIERIGERGLDLALIWGEALPGATLVKRFPMIWIGAKGGHGVNRKETLPLALFEPPCFFRQPAIEALEQVKQPWRLAFTSPSLSGLWAAATVGLGITARTPLSLPKQLMSLGTESGLPQLPDIALSLYVADSSPSPAVARLREILLDELSLAG
ncbi:MAG: LysR substrate-binding domain-containing protein [Bradyrhizobium sp.]|nr:LysR substrate-binding domain-containing protein [Bradyrhizobium sp.]